MPSLLDGVSFDVNQAIKDAISALGKYGPAVWQAAQHQVAAQATINFVLAIVLTFGFLVCLVVFLISLPKGDWNKGNGWVAAGVTCAIAGLPFFIAACVCWVTFYQYAAAPDWAALQLLKP